MFQKLQDYLKKLSSDFDTQDEKVILDREKEIFEIVGGHIAYKIITLFVTMDMCPFLTYRPSESLDRMDSYRGMDMNICLGYLIRHYYSPVKDSRKNTINIATLLQKSTNVKSTIKDGRLCFECAYCKAKWPPSPSQ